MTSRLPIAPPGLFRLLLALAVLLNHVTVVQSGRGAVLLFFVLSGYWVSDLWAKTPSPQRVPTFYLNRALRIWPLYLAVMLCCAAVKQHMPDIVDVLLFGVASKPFPHLIGTEWSLDIEVQFYAALPLLAALGARMRTPVAATATIACAILGEWLAARYGLVTLFKFMPYFAIGMALQSLRWAPSRAMAGASLTGFAALSVLQIWLAQTHADLLRSMFADWSFDAISTFWVVALLPYLAASLRRPSDASDRRLGDLSYPLYLVHLPVLIVLQEMFDWRTGTGVLVLLALTVVATYLFWRGIDQPADRWRKAILAARPFQRSYRSAATT